MFNLRRQHGGTSTNSEGNYSCNFTTGLQWKTFSDSKCYGYSSCGYRRIFSISMKRRFAYLELLNIRQSVRVFLLIQFKYSGNKYKLSFAPFLRWDTTLIFRHKPFNYIMTPLTRVRNKADKEKNYESLCCYFNNAFTNGSLYLSDLMLLNHC